MAQTVKRLPAMWETQVRFLGWEDPLEKEMATHSSTLAWKIPWMEPGRLQSMGSQRVGHDWAISLHFMLVRSSFLFFRSSKSVFISPSSLKHSFTGWQFSSFSPWKPLCHFLLASVVSTEKSVVPGIHVLLKVMYHFCSSVGSASFLFL